jgi:hypothetical protein
MMGSRYGRRTRIGGQFAARLIEMLESPAYRVLSLSARRVIDRVEIELGHHGGNDNGKLPVTFEQFVEYRMDRHAVAPAIREAVALGFLEVTEHGCGGNAEFRSPNLFRLTYRPANGAPGDGTHEWRLFKNLEDAEQTAMKARKENNVRRYRPKKQKPSGGKSHVSVGKTHTETGKSPVGETPTTVRGKTPTTSISRGGGGEVDGQSRLGGVHVGRGAQPPERHPEPEPTTAAGYVAYAKRRIAEASDPVDLDRWWARGRRDRDALDPPLTDAHRRELLDLLRAAAKGKRAAP